MCERALSAPKGSLRDGRAQGQISHTSHLGDFVCCNSESRHTNSSMPPHYSRCRAETSLPCTGARDRQLALTPPSVPGWTHQSSRNNKELPRVCAVLKSEKLRVHFGKYSVVTPPPNTQISPLTLCSLVQVPMETSLLSAMADGEGAGSLNLSPSILSDYTGPTAAGSGEGNA